MPLRIVIDVRRFRDFGIGTYIRNLLAALARADRENHYVLVSRREDAPELVELPVNFELTTYDRPDTDLASNWAFPLFLRRFTADLYHIPLSSVALMMPRPYVVTVHDLSALLFERREGWRGSLKLFHLRRGLLRAGKVIAVSGATRRDVEQLLGVPASRIRQIYNAPDPRFGDRPAPDESREVEKRRILERYQINYPFLLYAGTIRPQKNIPRLVEAFGVLRGELREHPFYRHLRLIIIGDEISRHPEVRRAVIHAGVEQTVRFLGFVPFETLRVVYECAAVFVFPSLYEGFGLPPLEAMAAGTPVVTSNMSSLPEVVGDAAMIVDPENVFEIARGIRDVLLDQDLRERLIHRGHQRLGHFSWDRTAAQVLETYREVAAAPRAG